MTSDKKKIRRIKIQFPDMLVLPELPDYFDNQPQPVRRLKRKRK